MIPFEMQQCGLSLFTCAMNMENSIPMELHLIVILHAWWLDILLSTFILSLIAGLSLTGRDILPTLCETWIIISGYCGLLITVKMRRTDHQRWDLTSFSLSWVNFSNRHAYVNSSLESYLFYVENDCRITIEWLAVEGSPRQILLKSAHFGIFSEVLIACGHSLYWHCRCCPL